jgi:PAS domain S-box-containing protein
MAQNDQSDKFAQLRQLAEAELMSLPRKLAGLSPDQQTRVLEEMLTQKPHVFQLVHELQVHQVELEMQHNELQETQEKLRQERARYAELYHNAPVGYLTTTPDGIISEVNNTGARLLGRDAVALNGQSLTQWIVPDDQDIYYFHLHHLANSPRVQTCELRIRQQQGPPITVRLESTGIWDAESGLQCRTVLLDVSERVRAEEALQRANAELEQRVEERTAELRETNDALRMSENRFRLVLQDSPTTVFTHDEQLRYTWIYPVRPGEEQILGKTDRDILQLDELPHLTEEEAERLMQLKQQVFDTAQGMRTEIRLTTESMQRWYDLKLEPLVAADGRPVGLTCVSTDITSYHQEREEQRRLADENARLYQAEQRERARAEAAAERITRLQRVTALLSEAHTPDEVYNVMVREGITATGAYAGGIALLQDDATTVELVYHQGYPPHLLEQWQRYPITAPSPIAACIRTGELRCIETRTALHTDYPAFEVADRSCAWANVPLMLDAQVRGCLFMSFAEERQFDADDYALLRNLAQQGAQALERAELYAAEQYARRMAEDAIKMRDQVFRLVSHDLRGPLSGIQGYTYLLRRRLNDLELSDIPRLISGLEQIDQATVRMNGQIQELLDAATVQAGQPISLSYGSFDLIMLLRRAIDLNQSTTEQHSLQLDTDISTCMFTGDEMRLERVFDNLLSNAIKYSPRGGDVVIRVTQPATRTSPGVRITVQDQGMGIPADALTTIFEPFRRARAADGQIAGTGLGLASARQIVQQHGGTIEVESEEGWGSTFTVWLPMEQDVERDT